jgi:hypothetical protein
MRKFLANFVNSEAIACCNDVTEVNIDDEENLLHIEEMFIGHQTRTFIDANDDILPKDLGIFHKNCQLFYIESVAQLKRRMPLSNPVINLLSILKSSERKQGSSSVISLAKHFPNIIPESMLDDLHSEWNKYKYLKLPSNITECRVDCYWNQISLLVNSNGRKRFTLLPKLMKCMLMLPHGNADSERLFSQVNLIKTKQRNRIETKLMNALLTLKCNYVTCLDFQPTTGMIERGKNALHQPQLQPQEEQEAQSTDEDDDYMEEY